MELATLQLHEQKTTEPQGPTAESRLVDALYEEATTWVATNYGKLDANTVLSLILHLIRFMEIVVSARGQGMRKKQILLAALQKVVNEHPGLDDNREALQFALDNFVPTFIDLSVSLARGAIFIGKKVKAGCDQNCGDGGCCMIR